MKRKIEGHYLDPKIDIDPLGSYTGEPADQTEEPIQDADDL